MAVEIEAQIPKARPPLSTAKTGLRMLLIGIALASIGATFAYFGGWLNPHALTPARFVDAFEQVDGVHSGFRRNHAKGVCVSGYFESNGQGVRLSQALVFQPGRVPVLGRFSLGGGQPYAADTPNAVRGMGLQFALPNGEFWRTAMINLPVFPVRTPAAFYEHLVAAKPDPLTGKPDPAQMKAFLQRHPEAVQAAQLIQRQPASSGFGNSTFRGLNAFRFINAAGESVPVRWTFKPVQPFEPADSTYGKNQLFTTLIAQVQHQPLRWKLIITVGKPGDPTNDATLPWPSDREQLDVGTLTLDRVESEANSVVRDLNFDPLVLPVGIAPSDDPLLSARSAVYSQSYTRRAGETKLPSAITPAEIQKGAP